MEMRDLLYIMGIAIIRTAAAHLTEPLISANAKRKRSHERGTNRGEGGKGKNGSPAARGLWFQE